MMGIRSKLKSILLMTLILLNFSVKADELLIAAEDDWIPYAKKDGTGMANEIIRAAFNSVGFKVKYKVMPYARILVGLEEGSLLAGFNVPLDISSKKKFLFGEEKLYDAVSYYYQHKDNPLKAKLRTELQNKERVGVVRGYGYGDHYLKLLEEKKITRVIGRSDSLNIQMLAKKRIDSTILYEKTAKLLLERYKLKDKIEIAFTNEATAIYLAFSKKHPKAEELSKVFDQGMRNIKASGELKKIIDSY